MSFEKYSKEQFRSLGWNTPDARKLADELEVKVNELIHPAVLDAFSKVVNQLNAHGHNLTNYDDKRPGNISFRDEPVEGQCHLRLGCNVVTCAGYGHGANALSQKARDSISKKLESTWERYIDAIQRFIAINISLIVGLAGLVSFLPKLQGGGGAPAPLESKGFLFWGFVLLMVSFVFQVSLRIWAQMFMEYEILPPKAEVDKYFAGRVHYTRSYRFGPRSYTWHSRAVRIVTALAALSFLAGLSFSLVFIYRNLR